MKLKDKFLNYPFNVNYFSKTPQSITSKGKIVSKKIDKSKDKINIVCSITYNNYKETVDIKGTLLPRKSDSRNSIISKIHSNIDSQNKSNSKSIKLPTRVNNINIKWQTKSNSNLKPLIFVVLLISIIIYFLKDNNLHTKVERRNKELIRDYSEFVTTFTLLLNAGLTPRKAWEKMCEDNYNSKKILYIEMKYTLNEMKSGISEKVCYEHFGKRCNLKMYQKFATLLNQNLKSGTKGLGDALEIEALESYKDRRAAIKIRGEEASTKLLLPMAMMLLVVMLIVIVPSFMQLQVN